jgi:uncharacterized protein
MQVTFEMSSLWSRAKLKPKQERRLLEKLYARIPKMQCIPGCHDCCGPVSGSCEEIKRAPLLKSFEHKLEFMIEFNVHCESCLSCPYASESGCAIYDDRPLICRLYGATEDSHLQCPHGRAPERKLTIAQTRAIWRGQALSCQSVRQSKPSDAASHQHRQAYRLPTGDCGTQRRGCSSGGLPTSTGAVS